MPTPLLITQQGSLYAISPDQLDHPLPRSSCLRGRHRPAQAANAISPTVEAVTSYTQKLILQSWAAGKGPMAGGARRNLANIEHREGIDSRGPAAPCRSASSRAA